ncbi:hypothetical protein HED60_12695 [Planctomycetales bacterium ZRK34]|nr:hypothetical protein HED60_12695 [Planctomycetales bacterium ZRK34]
MRIMFCTRCGGNDLRAGQIRNADQIHFQLSPAGEAGGSGWHRRRGADIPLQVAMCMDCGHIEMRGDIHAARRLETGPNAAGDAQATDIAADALHRAVG